MQEDCSRLQRNDPRRHSFVYTRTMENDLMRRSIEEDVEFEDSAAELEDRQSSPPTYEIATYPADFTLEVLDSQWKTGEIVIPPFQRGYVWSQVQASKLIESFLVGLPVPSIFLYTELSSEKSMVVDGQQRLRSVFYFFEGYFGEADSRGRRPVFTLKGLNPQSPYAGKTFADLQSSDESAARRLKNSVLRAFVIRQLNPKDDTSIFHVFERLNTGGTLLHNQEVRNAVCAGPFNRMLHELNIYQPWRELLGKKNIDSRMRDVELILRFFALRHAFEKYEKPMKDFMSRYMSTHADAPQEDLERYKKEFIDAVDAVRNTLGERPFHLYSGFNSSAFDAVMVAVSRHNAQVPEDFAQRWAELARSDELRTAVTGGTTDVDQVRSRMALVDRLLFDE